jgi:hypothetical protein
MVVAHMRLGGLRTDRNGRRGYAQTCGERRKSRQAQTQFTKCHDAPLTPCSFSPPDWAKLQNAHSCEPYEIAVTPPLTASAACADSRHKPLKKRQSGATARLVAGEYSLKSLIYMN